MQSDVLKDAIRVFGINSQLNMLVEECSELIKVCSKLIRFNNGELQLKEHEYQALLTNLVEEMVDVEIVRQQIKYFYKVDNEKIVNIMKYKLNRLHKKIEEYERK